VKRRVRTRIQSRKIESTFKGKGPMGLSKNYSVDKYWKTSRREEIASKKSERKNCLKKQDTKDFLSLETYKSVRMLQEEQEQEEEKQVEQEQEQEEQEEEKQEEEQEGGGGGGGEEEEEEEEEEEDDVSSYTVTTSTKGGIY
jgi:hypothetical protein